MLDTPAFSDTIAASEHDRVVAFLRAHGLGTDDWYPLAHTGFSAAHLYRSRDKAGRSRIIKRIAHSEDWVMRSTADTHAREAVVAIEVARRSISLRSPYLGACHLEDGTAYILMADLRDDLLPTRVLRRSEASAIIAAISEIHDRSPAVLRTSPARCSVHDRLGLLRPGQAPVLGRAGHGQLAERVHHGWQRFFRTAPPPLATAVARIHADPSDFVRHLRDSSPRCLLHGDLKIDNIAVSQAGRVTFFDWSLWSVSAPALDVGWFLAVNAASLPASNEDLIDEYVKATATSGPLPGEIGPMAALCGIVLRGWSPDVWDGTDQCRMSWWASAATAGVECL